jgi:hypothetical protein
MTRPHLAFPHTHKRIAEVRLSRRQIERRLLASPYSLETLPAHIARAKRQERVAEAQHVQLMPQHDDLGFQPCLRLERRDPDVEDQAQEGHH